jgi:hypothetical protein
MACGNLNSKTLDILSTCEPFRAACSASRAAHRRGRAIPDTLLRRGSIALLQSMIRKSGRRFSEKICSVETLERDDDSKKSHPALMVIVSRSGTVNRILPVAENPAESGIAVDSRVPAQSIRLRGIHRDT